MGKPSVLGTLFRSRAQIASITSSFLISCISRAFSLAVICVKWCKKGLLCSFIYFLVLRIQIWKMGSLKILILVVFWNYFVGSVLQFPGFSLLVKKGGVLVPRFQPYAS